MADNSNNSGNSRNWSSGTGQGWSGSGSSVGVGDILTVLKILNQNMSQLIQAIQAIFPRATGTFTLGNSISTVVQDKTASASAIIVFSPINAAAATLQGSANALYVSAVVPGTSFTVTTASGFVPPGAGGQQFAYYIVNPS